MLKLIDSGEDFPAWRGDCPFSARVTALFDTYGLQRFAYFWYQQQGDDITAVISRVDGNMTVAAIDRADFEELREFIDILGYSALTCDKRIADLLLLKSGKTSFIAEYKGGDFIAEYDSLVDMRELFDLLTECGFDMGGYESFLADFCARLNKGTAVVSAFHSEGELCASASALFIGRSSVLLGAVATRQDMRGRGLAGSLVKALASRFIDKRVYVFCRDDSVIGFYEKLGFIRAGEWAICERNSNE